MRRYLSVGMVVVMTFAWVVSIPLCGMVAAEAEGEFYLVGTGPGEADLITVRAINVIRQADLVICREQSAKTFSEYLRDKEVLTPPMTRYWEYLGMPCSELSGEARHRCEELAHQKKDRAAMIRKYVDQGKTVAVLEGGDPCIFGSLRWLKQEFDDGEFEVIPGVSSFNAASAALKREVADAYVGEWQTRSVILTTPARDGGRKDPVERLAEHRGTMVFFMAREFEEKTLPLLKRQYPPDTPVAVVYHAGCAEERVVRGTLGTFPVEPSVEERWMRLIYVGEFLLDASEKSWR